MLSEISGAVCVLFISILIYIMYLKKVKSDYWKKRGVYSPRGNAIFGHFKDCFFRKTSYGEVCRSLYLEHRELPVIGLFMFNVPALSVNDPVYIEKILKTDFSSFTDRMPSDMIDNNSLYADIFHLNGPKWKAMRNKISPVFTSLKLKSMMPQIECCFENASSYIDGNRKSDVDMMEVSAIFSHDVIVQCLFSIESKELSRPGTRFRRMQTEFFDVGIWRMMGFVAIDLFPRLANYIKVSYFPQRTIDYFQKLVEMTLNQREVKGCDRNDLVQLLLKIKEKKTIDIYDWDHCENAENSESTSPLETLEVTDELLESQAMIFFHTGIETLVSGLSFAVFELSRSPRVLDRLKNEIDSVTAKHGLTTKALQNMSYLDMCIKETLRMYPVVPLITRLCSRSYEFPCGVKVEPGDMVIVPVIGFHADSEYYQDPHVFRPERFTTDPQPYTYLPFGEGPRICFAMKFVQTELKMGLCKLIQRYDFSLSSRTELPMTFTKWTSFLKSSKPIWMNFTKRKSTDNTNETH